MTEEKEKEREWKDLTPKLVKLEKKGDRVQGVLLGFQKSTKYDKTNNLYTLENEDGISKFFGGAQLDDILPSNVGKEIRIIFQGESETSSGMKVKNFNIFVRESEDEIPF